MYWIYDYPSWEIGLLFVVVFVAVTWLGIALTRTTVRGWSFRGWMHRSPHSNEMVGLALSSYFVLYGLLLGLLAVATYQNYAQVGDVVDREASSLAGLYRDVGGYPPATRDALRAELREYARYTIEVGWKQQQQGIVPKGGGLKSVADTLIGFQPSTRGQEILHAEALHEFNHLYEVRRSRLASVTLGLPAVLWGVVVVGALLNIVLICLQDMEIHVHLVLGGVLAAILGTVIFLLAALDNPFRGEVSVGPDAIQLVYDTVLKGQ